MPLWPVHYRCAVKGILGWRDSRSCMFFLYVRALSILHFEIPCSFSQFFDICCGGSRGCTLRDVALSNHFRCYRPKCERLVDQHSKALEFYLIIIACCLADDRDFLDLHRPHRCMWEAGNFCLISKPPTFQLLTESYTLLLAVVQ